MSAPTDIPDPRAQYDVLAGVLIAAHGVQGALKLRLATRTALALIAGGSVVAAGAVSVGRRPVEVWLGPPAREPDADGTLATITQVKETQVGGSVYLVRIAGLRDRTAAEALVGRSVYAPTSRRAPLQEDEYFTEELIGLEVVGDTGQRYGRITAVLAQPANDVYETDQGALIPAVKAFVARVDVAAGMVAVYDVPGLRPSEAEEIAPGADDAASDGGGEADGEAAGGAEE